MRDFFRNGGFYGALCFFLGGHSYLCGQTNWKARLGSDPIFVETLDRYLASAASLVKQLPDPERAPVHDNWQPLADTGSALVNVYRLSGNPVYREQAQRIADFLLRSNDYIVAHCDPALPYLGWGPETRVGYFQCGNIGGYHADDLWDTASVMRFLLKVAELAPEPLKSPYYRRAKKIADEWPFVEHSPDDSAYAAAGLRWYRKSNEPCENRYVKNTNIAMGEQLFRIYGLTREQQDFDRAVKTLGTQIWDILIRHNLAYTSYMTYLDKSADYAAQVAHNERKVIHSNRDKPDDGIHCSPKDASCWNHLGYEGYAMFNIEQLTRDIPASIFPVASTKADIARTVEVTMKEWGTSRFADATKFDWSGHDSPTHITAYNCAQRFSGATLDEECRAALRHRQTSATVFYALVPESLF
ncbi:MAG TPA: hypothetical protein VGL72_23865 [Bryobacteraceae bacterium]